MDMPGLANKYFTLLILNLCTVQCTGGKQASPKDKSPSRSNLGHESYLANPSQVITLRDSSCAAIKVHLGRSIPDLSNLFCKSKALSKVSLDDVYVKDKKGKPILVFMKKSDDWISHLAYATPVYIHLTPVDIFEYLVTGVMKKGIAGKTIDESIKVYGFEPMPSNDPFVVSSYQYQLEFAQTVGEIELPASRLAMKLQKIYLPDEKIFIVAERNTEVIQDGLFKKWSLYLIFQPKADYSVMWIYLDMEIANLGIPELIKDRLTGLADKIPSQFFENISRITGEE